MTDTDARTLRVPDGTTARLSTFHGPSISRWLSTVITMISQAADAWGVTLHGIHDDGWTSILAHGVTDGGRRVIVKAIPERDRYLRELAALRHWQGQAVPEVIAANDEARLLLLPTIGPGPGGLARPEDHEARCAHRLPTLHQTTVRPSGHLPHLSRVLRTQLLPQLRRSALLRDDLGETTRSAIITLGDDLLACDSSKPVMLHGDLYASNVIFDAFGEPTFIDPRGLTGPNAYDWAFWCLFYLDDGLERRLSMLSDSSVANRGAVLKWVVLLAAARLRDHLRAGDHHGATQMRTALAMPDARRTMGE